MDDRDPMFDDPVPYGALAVIALAVLVVLAVLFDSPTNVGGMLQ